MNIGFEFSKDDIQRIIEILTSMSPAMGGKAYRKGLTLAMIAVEGELKKATTTGNPLKARTGMLSNSIGSELREDSDGPIAVIGSGVRRGTRLPYANILETGGTIRPKNAKYLTVPLKAAKTAGGAPRGRARDFSNTYVRRTASGALIIFQKSGRGNSIPLFVLKSQVEIPATRYMSSTRDRTQVRVVDIICQTMEKENKSK